MMKSRRTKGRPNKSLGVRYKADFKIDAVRKFETALEKGEISTEIAKRLKVSISSINRWRRQNEHLQSFSVNRASGDSLIDLAIRVLSDRDSHIEARLEAFFRLIIWQRWPSKPRMHAPAIISLMINYFGAGKNWRSFADIDEKSANIIFRNMSIEHTSQLCSPQECPNESFRLEDINSRAYNERDFLAQVILFLFSDPAKYGSSKHRMSLKRAYFASQNGAFRTKYSLSPKSFSALWRGMGAASAFYYVDVYHSSIDFDFDPWSKNFKSDMDSVVSDPDTIIGYLARVKYVIEALEQRLDPRARARLEFPAFPVTLAPEPVRPPALMSDLTAIMHDYLNY